MERLWTKPFITMTVSMLFLFATGLSMAALILAFMTKIPFQPKASTGKMAFFKKSVLSVTIAIFFLAVAYGGITTFLPLFAQSIKVNAGTFFLVYAVALRSLCNPK